MASLVFSAAGTRTQLATTYTRFPATWDSAYSWRWRASALNLRMPSASFSVAMASSLCIQRKVFSSRWRRSPVDAFAVSGSSCRSKSSLGLLQLVEEVRADGEQVRSGQADNLVHVAEARAHHLSLVAKFLVVVVNAGHGCDAGVLVGWNLRAAVLLFVPVVNTADEGRDQSHSRFGARDRLGEAEEQSQIAVDAFFFEPLGGADAFPGAGES